MRQRESKTKVIFVRHGTTDFPRNRIYCDDREDPPLNAEGRSQAARAAKSLAQLSIDVVVSSPLARTRETAEIIVEKGNLEIQIERRLRERQFGIWDGLYFDEIETQYPDEFLAWKKDKAGYTPENGETIYALHDRINAVLSELLEHHRGKTLLLVSHVGVIRVAFCAALDIPLDHYRQIQIDNAAVTRIDYGKEQNDLIFANHVSELGFFI